MGPENLGRNDNVVWLTCTVVFVSESKQGKEQTAC